MGGGRVGGSASLRKNYCREMKVTPLQIFFFWYNVAVMVLPAEVRRGSGEWNMGS